MIASTYYVHDAPMALRLPKERNVYSVHVAEAAGALRALAEKIEATHPAIPPQRYRTAMRTAKPFVT